MYPIKNMIRAGSRYLTISKTTRQNHGIRIRNRLAKGGSAERQTAQGLEIVTNNRLLVTLSQIKKRLVAFDQVRGRTESTSMMNRDSRYLLSTYLKRIHFG